MEKNRLIDGLTNFVTEATSTAKGLGKEAQTVFNTQLEKTLMKLDLVKSEDFEVLKLMVEKLSSDNLALKKRIEKLESLHGVGMPTSESSNDILSSGELESLRADEIIEGKSPEVV